MEPHNYNVDIDWKNSHNGIICSPELKRENGISIRVGTPPSLHEGIAGLWTPEHLFVAAVNGCLMTTFLVFAKNAILDFTNFTCQAVGKLEMVEGTFMMSDILLNPTVVITDEMHRKKALRILKKAKNKCSIVHSIKSKITMETTVRVEPVLIENT
jgi:organic hydroperoxide reductase OsmC/OhrA|tara:strand:- start:206 stop:673 length:468 start_codon:yes stop_codon:yes gene_type:complete